MSPRSLPSSRAVLLSWLHCSELQSGCWGLGNSCLGCSKVRPLHMTVTGFLQAGKSILSDCGCALSVQQHYSLTSDMSPVNVKPSKLYLRHIQEQLWFLSTPWSSFFYYLLLTHHILPFVIQFVSRICETEKIVCCHKLLYILVCMFAEVCVCVYVKMRLSYDLQSCCWYIHLTCHSSNKVHTVASNAIGLKETKHLTPKSAQTNLSSSF